MKAVLAVNLSLLFILLLHSIKRDWTFQQEGAGDLRNRVVGARLAKIGRDPYFYKWKNGDSYAYLDYANADTNTVSVITATPLFHRLIAIISDYDQKTISVLWFVVEYLALLAIILAGVFLTTDEIKKIVVTNIGVLFTYTHAWALHLLQGQMYIFVAALLMFVGFLLTRHQHRRLFSILAGIATWVLIFVRPISIVSLIPFALSNKRFATYLAATTVCSLAYLAFIFVNENEKMQWINYKAAMVEQVKVHQNLPRHAVTIDRLPAIKKLEGLDLEAQQKAAIEHPFPDHSENGNVFFDL